MPAFTLFIFSDSDRAQFVAQELENINATCGAQIRYEIFSYKDPVEDVIKRIESTEGVRKLLILSEEKSATAEQDTDVFLLLLQLKTGMKITKDIEIYVELVNIDNIVPVQNLGAASVILTNKIISLYMLQLLTHKESRRFFKDILLTNAETGDVDLDILPADQLLRFDTDALRFSCFSEAVQSFFMASGKQRMLIGYFPDGTETPSFFCDGMDKAREVVIRPGDRLITVKYAEGH